MRLQSDLRSLLKLKEGWRGLGVPLEGSVGFRGLGFRFRVKRKVTIVSMY